jgi:hypothetical protein
VTATVADDAASEPLVATSGWAHQPDQREMQSVSVNRPWLEEVAAVTGGRTVEFADLEEFTGSLPQSSAPLVENWSWPLWHSWWVFLTAIGCIATDWGLRRRRGLP